MIFYPGGFDINHQFFSELGATVTKSGELNNVSSLLFLVANFVIGLTLVPFWLMIPSILKDTRGLKAPMKLGSILGLLSCPFIIGTACYPIDTQLRMHSYMFMVFFPLFNLASLIYSITLILNHGENEKYGGFGVLLFLISILVVINPSASYVSFIQKILLYGYFIWVLLLNRLITRIRITN
jgi:hypothetical protein